MLHVTHKDIKRRALPSYQELTWNDTLQGRISWDFFDSADELGTIGLIGDEQVVAAASEIVRGARFNLSLPLNQPDPAPGGRPHYEHHIYASERNSFDDWLDRLYMQSSSQWDGLRHVQAREFGFFDGRPGGGRSRVRAAASASSAGPSTASSPVRSSPTSSGTPTRMTSPCPPLNPRRSPRNCSPTPWSARGCPCAPATCCWCAPATWRRCTRYPRVTARTIDYRRGCPGLVGSEAMAELLWDWHVAAVCADNPAVEVRPGDRKDGSLHRRAIAMLGLALGELFDLEALADGLRRPTTATPHSSPGSPQPPGRCRFPGQRHSLQVASRPGARSR